MLVVEKDGIIEVYGEYNEMKDIFPKLKTWKFKWNPSKRIWWIDSSSLSGIKRKRFEELMGTSKQKAEATEAEVVSVFKEVLTTNIPYFTFSLAGNTLHLVGKTKHVHDIIREAGGVLKNNQWVFIPINVDIPKFKRSISKLLEFGNSYQKKMDLSTKLFQEALDLKLFRLKFTEVQSSVNSDMNYLVLKGNTYDLYGDIKSAGGVWDRSDGVAKFFKDDIELEAFKKLLRTLDTESKKDAVRAAAVKSLIGDTKKWSALGVYIAYLDHNSSIRVGGDTRLFRDSIKELIKGVKWTGTWDAYAESISTDNLLQLFKILDAKETKLKSEEDAAAKLNVVPDSKCHPNQRGGMCTECGALVDVGGGCIFQVFDDDDEKWIWKVKHRDKNHCEHIKRLVKLRQEYARTIGKAKERLRDLIMIPRNYAKGKNLDPPGEMIFVNKTGLEVGGGSWVVLEPGGKYVWYVRNNGSDGADWSHNNVRTWGAGAMGYRTELTDEILMLINVIRKHN